MSSPLTLGAAFSQLGSAAYGVAYATWKAPFTGGKLRMVTIGLPVLFVTAATGAIIYTVMTSILGAIYIRCRKGAYSVAKYFENRSVKPIPPKKDNHDYDKRTHRKYQIPTTLSSTGTLARNPLIELEEVDPVILTPLPQSAAKERNEALLKFLNLVDKYLIDPWIIKNAKFLQKAEQTEDPFLNEMIRDEGALRAWLRSLALWQLGVQWDQLETKFVKMETPEPPTLKSLVLQIQAAQIEPSLTERLIDLILSEEEGKVPAFQKAVTESRLLYNKQMTLIGISLQLDVIIRQAPVDPRTQANETEKIRQKFAIVMHSGMAITLSQTSLIIEGWMTVIQQISSQSPHFASQDSMKLLKEELFEEDLPVSKQEASLQRMVGKTSAVLSGQLSERYLLPLWEKQQSEWEQAIGEGLGRENVKESSPAHTLVNRFIKGEINEETFLQAADSYGLSTALTSNLSFFRAIRIMQFKGLSLKGTIRTLPASLLLQIEPLLVGTLNKSAKMLSEINLATTVPKVVEYALDLLNCCRAMQDVREEVVVDESFLIIPEKDRDSTPLMTALAKGGEGVQAARVDQLCLEAPERGVTGSAVIEKLGPRAHKAVRLSQPEIQERTWIHKTKERLEGLLRVKATEYAQEPKGAWLTTLLQSKPNGNGRTSLIGSLLSMQSKLWTLLPGMENVAKILVMGVQTFFEEHACEAIQKGLNDITSTRFLSANIGITLVKGLLEKSKEPKAWRDNFPLLQQAYAFLQPDEQERVLKHLKAQHLEPLVFQERQAALTTPPINSRGQNDHIERMKREENQLIESLESISKAYQELKKNEGENRDEIALLENAYDKLKRKKDLIQFERIKGLVIYATDSFLETKLTFRGGGHLKQIILAVIHEAYTLLSYQEVVKHWIFTIVDLLLDELEEATSLTQAHHPLIQDFEEEEETPSLLNFIQPLQRGALLNHLVELMETSTKQEMSGWFSVGSWMKTGANVASKWATGTIWGYIEAAFKEDLRVTPPQLTGMALEKLEAFAIDPGGLSYSVIQALTENVADPRPRKLILAEEEALEHSLQIRRPLQEDYVEFYESKNQMGDSSLDLQSRSLMMDVELSSRKKPSSPTQLDMNSSTGTGHNKEEELI